MHKLECPEHHQSTNEIKEMICQELMLNNTQAIDNITTIDMDYFTAYQQMTNFLLVSDDLCSEMLPHLTREQIINLEKVITNILNNVVERLISEEKFHVDNIQTVLDISQRAFCLIQIHYRNLNEANQELIGVLELAQLNLIVKELIELGTDNPNYYDHFHVLMGELQLIQQCMSSEIIENTSIDQIVSFHDILNSVFELDHQSYIDNLLNTQSSSGVLKNQISLWIRLAKTYASLNEYISEHNRITNRYTSISEAAESSSENNKRAGSSMTSERANKRHKNLTRKELKSSLGELVETTVNALLADQNIKLSQIADHELVSQLESKEKAGQNRYTRPPSIMSFLRVIKLSNYTLSQRARLRPILVILSLKFVTSDNACHLIGVKRILSACLNEKRLENADKIELCKMIKAEIKSLKEKFTFSEKHSEMLENILKSAEESLSTLCDTSTSANNTSTADIRPSGRNNHRQEPRPTSNPHRFYAPSTPTFCEDEQSRASWSPPSLSSSSPSC